MPTIEEIREHRYIVVLNGDYKGQTLYVTNWSENFLDCKDSNGNRKGQAVSLSDVRLATQEEIYKFQGL